MKFSTNAQPKKAKHSHRVVKVSQQEVDAAVARRKTAGTFCINCETRTDQPYCTEECQYKAKRKLERMARSKASVVPVSRFTRAAVKPGKTYSVPSI